MEEKEDVNLTLAEVVKSGDLRLWEGFSLILANCAEKWLFDYNEVNRHLKKSSERKDFTLLVALSLALYKSFHLKFSWKDKLYDSLSDDGKKGFAEFLEKLKNNSDFYVGNKKMSAQRLKNVFSNYFYQTQNRLNELLSIKDELNLEYLLSQVFFSQTEGVIFKEIKTRKVN